jgi:hypothetical protein
VPECRFSTPARQHDAPAVYSTSRSADTRCRLRSRRAAGARGCHGSSRPRSASPTQPSRLQRLWREAAGLRYTGGSPEGDGSSLSDELGQRPARCRARGALGHVMALLSKAIDETRRGEVCRLRAKGKHAALTKTRWVLLTRKRNLTGTQRVRLRELLAWSLRTVRAYLLKEEFQYFWTYTTAWAGRRFLASWTRDFAPASTPIEKFARTLRTHEAELLNWLNRLEHTSKFPAYAIRFLPAGGRSNATPTPRQVDRVAYYGRNKHGMHW